MKYTILMGSPKPEGNTARILDIFMEENRKTGIEQELVSLYDRDIRPCLGCKSCQNAADGLGCVHGDDFPALYDAILDSDLLVLATPIYSWFCTPPMKAMMDRLIYAGCKYYGAHRQSSSLRGIRVATLTTCGYPPHKGADLWEEGLRRWCRHGEMEYLGMYCRRDTGKPGDLIDSQVEIEIREFARAMGDMAGRSL